jgi:L-amino acid N-acyltransferase YncA
MAVAIRHVMEADLPQIAAIYGEAVETSTVTFETVAPGHDEMRRRAADLGAGGFPYLVADDGGRIAGYAYAGPYHRRAAYRSTVEDSVYVASEFRGRGVGRLLLAALLAECERLGFRQMIAIIVAGESPASVALHEGLGFSSAGRLRSVGHKHERWLDTVLMQRALGPGDAEPPSRV